jgi:small subunit ribosomal protein S7
MAFKKWTASIKQLTGDPRFNSKLVAKFINCLMYDGNKAVAQKVVYEAMDIIAQKTQEAPPLEIFEKALENVKPLIEVRSRRVGGANYQVPMQVNRKRQQSLAIRWILEAIRGGKGSPTSQRLATELMSAFKREGAAMSTRENIHRMAEANKAFAHFAW